MRKHLDCAQGFAIVFSNLTTMKRIAPLYILLLSLFAPVVCSAQMSTPGQYKRESGKYADMLLATAKEGKEDVLQILIKDGADVHATNRHGETALHIAAEYGHKGCVELLLKAPGIDVNRLSEYNMTPADSAHKGGHAACAELIQQAGGNCAGPATVGFGSSTQEQGLVGTLYDLKRTAKGNPSGMKGGAENQHAVIEALSLFFKDWSRKTLKQYYRVRNTLHATNWYMPPVSASYAPIAFGVADPKERDIRKWDFQPSAWLVVYRGKVIAPKSGKFRFVGTGDDFIAVRFNKKTVLDAGYRMPTRWDKKNPRKAWVSGYGDRENYRQEIASGKDKMRASYEFITGVPGCRIWDMELGGLTAGTPFTVKRGGVYPIEIALSEIPGGKGGFVLFIEDITHGKQRGVSTFDLFTTNGINPDVEELYKKYREANCYAGDSRIQFSDTPSAWRVYTEEDDGK